MAKKKAAVETHSKAWSVPRMWDGCSCVILAGGPSLTPEVVETVRLAHEHRVIAVNNAYQLAPWADLLYAADMEWWAATREALHFAGLKVTCTANPFEEVLELKVGDMVGFNPNPSVVCTGGNSGYQAVCIAAHAGCKRILLCGFDMKPGHWHGDHKPPLRETQPSQYVTWIERFRTLAQPLWDRGIQVVNCTPGSALDAFPHGALVDELLRSRKAA